MVWRLAIKDVLERWRDGRLPWAGGAVVLLLLAALAVGFDRQRAARAEQTAGQALDYQDWLKQGRRHPHDAAHQGMHAFKPDAVLAIVDPGINPYIGSTVWLQAHRQSEVKFRPAQDATGLQRFGDLSASWVLQVLGPLLVIVLGFNAFAGEREQGTLRQLVSLGVSPRQLLAGKAIALLACLAVLLAPAGAVAAVAIAITGDAAAGVDAAVRFVSLAAAYGLYLTTFVFVALGVSALAPTSRVAITVLMALWIGQAVVAPRVMSEAARIRYPTPTRLQFDEALAVDWKATSDRTWMQAFGTTDRWGPEVPLNRWGLALQLDDHANYQVYDRQFGRLWDTWERQQALQEWSGVALPMLAVRAFSMALAGTDFAHHRAFTTAAELHRRTIQNLVSEDLVAHADPLGDQHFAYQAGSAFWAKVPPFAYRPPTAGWALRRGWRASLALVAAFVLAVAFAIAATSRRRMP